MLWLHWGKFVNGKWLKIPSLAALQVAKYMRKMIAYDYSRTDWDGLRDHLRDVP